MIRLIEYDALAQHYGQWLSGYEWGAYGCGTFANRISKGEAKSRMKRFLERLEKAVGSGISAMAVLENRYSGLGMSPIDLHWHFVLASPERPELLLHELSTNIWGRLCGNSVIGPYDPHQPGTFYLTKVVAKENGELLAGTWTK